MTGPHATKPDVADIFAAPLVQFLTIARHENLTHAAAELGVAQSSLSRALVRWERQLGLPLITRVGRSFRLTRHGRSLQNALQRCSEGLERASADLADNLGVNGGTVALGFLNTLGSRTVPEILRAYRGSHPEAQISLHQGSSEFLLDALREGDIDLCLISPAPDSADFAIAKLFSEQLVLVVPPTHPLATHSGVALTDVASDDFLAMPRGYGLRATTERLCALAGFSPRIVFESTDTATLRGLAAAGFGVCVLATAPDATGSIEIPISNPPASRPILLTWATTRAESRATASLRHYILDHLR
ncbi:LysR family transcriptional regulator [Streptomyces sp. NPDC059582]|uniref:LysR family transcriptional regulator n=1 Tax=Streptomyces sp. NPDC059582 TaxID=3346875 RepID=UPI00368F5DE5